MPASTGSSAAVDAELLREHMSCWPTGVTVITSLGAGGVPLGKAANSFHSVSLQPPLVGWCVDRLSTRYEEWLDATGYVVHVLGSDQAHLMRRFAGRGGDKFRDLDWRHGYADLPVLGVPVPLRLECRTVQRIAAGDHTYLVGEVVTAVRGPGSALCLHHPDTPEERAP